MTRVRQAAERAGEEIKERAHSGIFIPLAALGVVVALLFAARDSIYNSGRRDARIETLEANMTKLTAAVTEMAKDRASQEKLIRFEVRLEELQKQREQDARDNKANWESVIGRIQHLPWSPPRQRTE